MNQQVIHPSVRMGSGCVIGEYAVICEGVEFGDHVQIGHHVVIHPGTRIGNGVRIDDHAVLGKQPSIARTSTLRSTELSPLTVGAGSTVGTGAIVYAGTEIGAECLLADGAQVRERCVLGCRVIVGRNSTIENDCRIGDFTKLQTSVYVTARSTIEENCFIAPCVVTSNDNYVGRTEARHAEIRGAQICRGARVGAGAVLLPGVTIGQEALVAAGAIVTRDVPPYVVAMGSPARPVRDVPAEQLLYPREGEHQA